MAPNQHIVVECDDSCYDRTEETVQTKKEKVRGEQEDGGIKPVCDCEFSWLQAEIFCWIFLHFVLKIFGKYFENIYSMKYISHIKFKQVFKPLCIHWPFDRPDRVTPIPTSFLHFLLFVQKIFL